MLRICDILVRIRIRGSMPLTNGSGSGFWSGSCYFRHWPSRPQPKNNNKKFFCSLLLEGTFASFFEDKKSKRSHKKSQNSRNQGFSYYFCLMIEGSGSGSVPLTKGFHIEACKVSPWSLKVFYGNPRTKIFSALSEIYLFFNCTFVEFWVKKW